MAKKTSIIKSPLLFEQIEPLMETGSDILIYQTKDGSTKVDVQLVDETVWLTQAQICQLFQKSKSTISEHIKHIFKEGELDETAVVRNFRTTAADGKSYDTAFYNLDVIISVGYRVKSHIGTHFRIWATQRLREYIIKGFTMDDDRLKKARNNYFEELLSRIRDIRSSERVFYRKVCDIFATSIDYDTKTELANDFFASVQNKFHWAIHAHTAAELIVQRANADRPNMGLTNFSGERIAKNDVVVAKNYLHEDELEILNRIVNQFLEFAELQAMQRKPMYMQEWTIKLHGFLTLNDREILSHAGKVSRLDAENHANKEYEKYREAEAKRLDAETDDLDRALKKLNEVNRKIK